MTYNIYLPVIMQGQPQPPLSLGVQIEHHQVQLVKQWIVSKRQYQTSVKWRDIETVKGKYNWSLYDADFAVLVGQRITIGIKVIPEWARLWNGYVASPPKPECYSDLARFIIMLIERYKPDAIELFNEPDVDRDGARWAEEFFGAWCVSNNWYGGGLLYGDCLNKIYPIIHSAYPNVRIIAGALIGAVSSSLQFLDGAIHNKLLCDAVSFHKYINVGGNFNSAFEFALSISNRINKPIVLSETSVLNNVDSLKLEQEQSNYLKYLRDNYRNSCIDVIQWYSLANNGWSNADLVRNNKPTLVYNEFIREE